MAYNKTCERCGCSLDPGETCDCSHTGYKPRPRFPVPEKKSTKKQKKKVTITGYGVYRDDILDSVYDDIKKAHTAKSEAEDNYPMYSWDIRERVRVE
ncbi:MAG: hypothetical protein AB9835_10250 [Eubacteriales bacterium]